MDTVWGDLRAHTEKLNDALSIQSTVAVRASTISEARTLLRGGLGVRVSLRRKGVDDSLILVREKHLDGKLRDVVKQVGDGSIIKRFDRVEPPANPSDIVCPHFLELKWAYGCPWDCSWCYLKGTLRFQETKTQPVLKDVEKVERHLKSFLKGWHGKELLNSGEICDSLMFEHNGYALSKNVLPLFKRQKLHKVLVVTKSVNVDNLVENDFTEEAMISFSLNSERVANRWEKAPLVGKRIEAASRLHDSGYKIRIRIDPMVPIPKWIDHYVALVDRVFEKFEPERVTIGSLRGLQSTINNCPDKSWVKHLGEGSNWGRKISFDRRYSMYSSITRYLERAHGYDKFALCKETLSMWDKIGLDHQEMKCNCIL